MLSDKKELLGIWIQADDPNLPQYKLSLCCQYPVEIKVQSDSIDTTNLPYLKKDALPEIITNPHTGERVRCWWGKCNRCGDIIAILQVNRRGEIFAFYRPLKQEVTQ